MNPLPTTGFWVQSLGTLALQTSLVLIIAGAAQALIQSPRRRRTLWLGALTCLTLVTVYSVTGLERRLGGWLAAGPEPTPRFTVRGNLPAEFAASPAGLGDSELRPTSVFSTPIREQPSPTPLAVWWPAWLWLAGAFAVSLRAAIPRLWLALAGRRTTSVHPADGPLRIRTLAARLGFRRPVRIFASARLAGPIAFGVLRPAVGLPAGFWTEHGRTEQDVMLAHELAHLAGRDPLWLGLADLLAVLFWWHPLVWWARRQFRAASEAAADEASLVVENGPAVLAGCLVALANRWQQRGVLGLLGMAGFRSGLGRRVERLLELQPAVRAPNRPFLPQLLTGLGCVAVFGTAVALPAWTWPNQPPPDASLLAIVGQALTRTPASAPNVNTSPTPTPGAGQETQAGGPGATHEATPDLVCLVQFPAIPGLEPKQVQILSMDALTRRLWKLDRFKSVKCEPMGDDQIRVALKFRDGSPAGVAAGLGALPAMQRLIEQPGHLKFRRVHPESDTLAARGESADGYEWLAQTTAPGVPAPRLLVALKAEDGLDHAHITEAAVRRDRIAGEPRVSITFDSAGRDRFAEVTASLVGQRIALVLDGRLVMAPRIIEAISGGQCEISGRFSDEEASSLAAALAHPLPGPLKLVSTKPAVPTGAAPQAVPASPAKQEKPASASPAQPATSSTSISPHAGPTVPAGKTDGELLIRMYRLDPNRLRQGFGPVADPGQTNASFLDALQRLFTAAGLDFGRTNAFNAFPGIEGLSRSEQAGGSIYFFKPDTGVLFVRATAKEMEVIEQIIVLVDSAPPQIMVEAKFVEITQEETKALGFDWYLGQTLMTDRPLTDRQKQLAETLPLPFRGGVAAREQSATNSPREWRGDQLNWPGQQATNAGNIRVNATLGEGMKGVLTDPQFRVVLRALEQRNGVKILSAPKVTTLSGRQAQVQMVDIQTVLTGVNPDALQQPGAKPAAGVLPFTTAQIPVGPTLDITPSVSADGHTIQLTVRPTMTEFLGYDEAPKDSKVRVWDNGKTREVDVPLPRFRVRQMATTMNLWDGQTLVLGGQVIEEPEKDQNGKPRQDGKTVRKQLLVFITPTIVDPAGNRVHSADNSPFVPYILPARPTPGVFPGQQQTPIPK